MIILADPVIATTVNVEDLLQIIAVNIIVLLLVFVYYEISKRDRTSLHQSTSGQCTDPGGDKLSTDATATSQYRDADYGSLEVPQKQVRGKLEAHYSSNEYLRQIVRNKPVKPPQEKLLPSSLPEIRFFTGYNKPAYAVLIGNSVKVYNTKTYASLPQSNKFFIKERHRDSSGMTRVKLTLKSAENER